MHAHNRAYLDAGVEAQSRRTDESNVHQHHSISPVCTCVHALAVIRCHSARTYVESKTEKCGVQIAFYFNKSVILNFNSSHSIQSSVFTHRPSRSTYKQQKL